MLSDRSSTVVSLRLKAKHIQRCALQVIIILMARPISANNSSHGAFEYASKYCSQRGGLVYNNIVTRSLLTDYKENNCSLANSLVLNDGEALWIGLQAELGAYITEHGCATALPQDFTLKLTGKPSLFQCTKECLARGSMNYISFHNAQCFCMADNYSNLECLDSSHAAIYRRFQFDVGEGKHICIAAQLNNRQLGYTSTKCSAKHSGVCVDRSTQSKLQSNCTKFNHLASEIGRNFCVPPEIYIKDEMKGKCSEYNGKLTPYLYQGILHYLNNGVYFQDSFLTFDPQTNEEYSGSEDFLACLSITKQGCMLILETEKCDNVNRYLCGDDIHFGKPTGATTRMVSDCIFLCMCLFLKNITYYCME